MRTKVILLKKKKFNNFLIFIVLFFYVPACHPIIQCHLSPGLYSKSKTYRLPGSPGIPSGYISRQKLCFKKFRAVGASLVAHW